MIEASLDLLVMADDEMEFSLEEFWLFAVRNLKEKQYGGNN